MKYAALFQKIDAIIDEHSMLKHDFYRCWQEGKLKKSELQDYIKQYKFVEGSFPQFFSAVHANCDDAESRSVMLNNLMEEEAGKDNHFAQFVRFATKGLDVPESEFMAQEANESTAAFQFKLSSLTKDNNMLRGIAAMIVYKQQIHQVARTKVEGLKSYYDITDEDALKFYTTHSAENRDWHNLMDKHYSEEQEASVLEAVKETAQAFWGFLDGVTTPEISARVA